MFVDKIFLCVPITGTEYLFSLCVNIDEKTLEQKLKGLITNSKNTNRFHISKHKCHLGSPRWRPCWHDRVKAGE